MKKLVISAALAALLAAPAIAQTQPRPVPRAQPQAVISPQGPAVAAPDEETEAFAAYTGPGYGDVVVDGVVVGRDPDPHIQYQLKRDPAINLN